MATAPASQRPKKLGNFEVLREIGRGGMGRIYLARQPALERQVVLKKIRRELLDEASAVERFQREARAAAAVHHQNVVAVYDCFEYRGDHFIAQEFVDGPDLNAILTHTGPIDPGIAALIGLEILRGLEEIHAQGIVHRDLKPANILIGSGGQTKIADFGIALGGRWAGLTRPGILVGSLPYMSPEQMLGKQVDHRIDLFSFGVMLYEMIAGEPPFIETDDDTTEALLERIEQGRYCDPRQRVPGLPRFVARLIRACLRASPSRRPQSAIEARRYLEKTLGRISPPDARREIALYLQRHDVFPASDDRTAIHPAPALRRGTRRRRYAALLAVGAVALAGAFALSVGRDARSPAPRRPARVVSSPPRTPPPTLPVQAPTTGEPALVRFAAYPWAEVRFEDGSRFYTPHAAPVELSPGHHEVMFEHPTFGQALVGMDLEPGEKRIVRHVFERAPRP